MAQRRLRDFKEPLTSFDHNLINLGVHKPGRFAGYDLFVTLGGLDFKIQHSGVTVKDPSMTSFGPLGVMMTTQGLIVVEDTELAGPFTINSNAGNNFERVDLLVASHQYLSIEGGQVVTYSVIPGPIGGAGDPPLNAEDYQTILGRILMPPNATSSSQATYVKAKSPDSGDGEDARLTTPNQFATLNRFNFSPTAYNNVTNSEVLSSSKIGWTLKDDGNCFSIISSPEDTDHFIDALRLGKGSSSNGVEIKLQINSFCTLRSNQVLTSGDISRGFDALYIPSIFANQVNAVDFTLQIKPPAGELWLVSLIRSGSQWVVINVQGQSTSPYKRGMIMEVALTNTEINQNFNPDGLGKNLFLGWQWANGNRGTLDMRCRVSTMTSTGPNSGAEVLSSQLLTYAMGDKGGSAMKTLDINEMPAHTHSGFQANHFQHSSNSFVYPQGTTVTLLVNTLAGGSGGIVYVADAKTGAAGGSNAFDNRMPFIAVGKIQRLY